jgi:anti-sigma28 factor (negative regulator of flagellin synthesis)
MISQTNNMALRAAYPSKVNEAREPKQTNILTENETTKVDQLKEAIGSGEYKVNIEALSEKMADSLLS